MKTNLILFIFFATSVVLPAQPGFGEDALTFYGELRNRTILRPAAVPRVPDEVLSQAVADRNRAVALIEDALKKNHFIIVDDGDKFLRVMPEAWQDSPGGQYLSHISPIHPPQKPNATEELLPKGAINFSRVEINEVLKIYAEYRKRNVLMPFTLNGSISLRTQTPVTIEEASYALNVVMALNGLAAVDDGEKFVQVVPVVQVNQLKLNAPEPEKNAALIAPESVPKFSPQIISAVRLPGSLQQHSPSSTLDDLANYYARLSASKYIPDPMYGKWPAMLRITVPVTKPELQYAIETTLRFMGLAITKTNDETLTIQRIPR
jgi:hypothetical protein